MTAWSVLPGESGQQDTSRGVRVGSGVRWFKLFVQLSTPCEPLDHLWYSTLLGTPPMQAEMRTESPEDGMVRDKERDKRGRENSKGRYSERGITCLGLHHPVYFNTPETPHMHLHLPRTV